MAYKVVYKVDEFVNLLKTIATQYPTVYKNWYPYNLGYYNSDGKWSFDCWNLIKAVIWGWKPEKKVGYFQKINTSTGLGDWNGWTILQCCSEKSSDFTKVPVGAFLLTGNADHAGIFVGEVKVSNKTYNVVECTPIWKNGVQLAYVDEKGRRFNNKGGAQAGSWKYHGKLPWIDYTAKKDDTPAPAPTPTPTPSTDGIEVGDKVEVVNAVTYTGQPFWCYYDIYTVMEVRGDRAVIGIDGIVTAAINVKNLKKVKTPQVPTSKIAVGDEVTVKKAELYNGGTFKCWYPSYKVMELVGDRAVIGVNGVITAAVNVKNLQKKQ